VHLNDIFFTFTYLLYDVFILSLFYEQHWFQVHMSRKEQIAPVVMQSVVLHYIFGMASAVARPLSCVMLHSRSALKDSSPSHTYV
jgi:uncharacterized membrane protein YobD (UPF0266 family)